MSMGIHKKPNSLVLPFLVGALCFPGNGAAIDLVQSTGSAGVVQPCHTAVKANSLNSQAQLEFDGSSGGGQEVLGGSPCGGSGGSGGSGGGGSYSYQNMEPLPELASPNSTAKSEVELVNNELGIKPIGYNPSQDLVKGYETALRSEEMLGYVAGAIIAFAPDQLNGDETHPTTSGELRSQISIDLDDLTNPVTGAYSDMFDDSDGFINVVEGVEPLEGTISHKVNGTAEERSLVAKFLLEQTSGTAPPTGGGRQEAGNGVTSVGSGAFVGIDQDQKSTLGQQGSLNFSRKSGTKGGIVSQ